MKYILNKIVDFIYPKRCAMCDNALMSSEKGVCSTCMVRMKPLPNELCVVCGRGVDNHIDICDECRKKRVRNYTSGRYALSYEVFSEGLYRFKYNNRTEYAKYYAEEIYKRHKLWIETIDAEALVPVPIHKKRFLKRGYNQAELVARELSKLTGIPCVTDLIERRKNTNPQKIYGDKMRQINVKKAFIVRKNSVKLKKIIIVDDIFTTGSTIEEMSRVLKKTGVRDIYFLTVSASRT